MTISTSIATRTDLKLLGQKTSKTRENPPIPDPIYGKLRASLHDPPRHFYGWFYRRRCGQRGAVNRPKNRPGGTDLLIVLEIGNQIVEILGVIDAAEGHAVALHLGLRVRDVVA